MTPLQQSLVILTAVRNSIERVVLCFYNANGSTHSRRPDRYSDVNLSFSMQNYLQILLSSFLEEWRRFSSFAKDNPDVRETLCQVQPAMVRFKPGKDLRSVRSKMLAHPFRENNGNIVFAWELFRDSDTPTTFAETLLLGFCALMVVDRVQARHAQDLAAAESHLLQQDRSVPEKGVITPIELHAEFARIYSALQAELQ